MSDNLKYCVLPHEPNLQPIPDPDAVFLAESEKIIKKGLNIWIGSVLWVVIGAAIALLGQSILAAIVIPSIVVALIALSIRSNNALELHRRQLELEQRQAEQTKKAVEEKRRIELANQREISRFEKEAASLTSGLTRTYESSANLVTELPQYLNQASDLLKQAEAEYSDNAFAPFWDAVESAVRQLAAFNDKAKQLSKSADEFYSKLDGRKHTFPTFPANTSTIPDPTAVVNELRHIARMGQTNFQFANIWEHRRTREVLIAGFRTLGEAVNNLGATIEYSISDLQQSVSSDVAKLVEQEIKTRESLDKRMLEQNRMLDNIQHQREPRVTDSPSKY